MLAALDWAVATGAAAAEGDGATLPEGLSDSLAAAVAGASSVVLGFEAAWAASVLTNQERGKTSVDTKINLASDCSNDKLGYMNPT